MRYYRERYPEVDELVMVQVRQIAEMGAYVKLKLIRVGRNEVVITLRVDKEKGYIDLSKRRVSPEDITKCEERFVKSKTVASIMRYTASKLPGAASAAVVASSKEVAEPKDEPEPEEDTVGGVAEAGTGTGEEELEALYELIAWPLGDKYGHPYDAFKRALTEPDEVFAGLNIPKETLDVLMKTIGQRLTPQPIKLRADIELTCFKPAGIDAIKRALKAGEAASTATVPIKARLIAPPFYVLDTNATDKVAGVKTLEDAIDAIKVSISHEGGDLNVKMKPKAVSETDETELADLLARASKENTQVAGDDVEDASDDDDV